MRSKLTFAWLSVALAGCSSVGFGTTGTWRASVDNGDKPGIGIELTRNRGSITGRMFLLSPDRPHDFAAGSPHTMQIRYASETEIRFAVDWLPDFHEELILRLSAPLQGRRVRGTLESDEQTDAATEYMFVRIR